jgi:hypothetical protein
MNNYTTARLPLRRSESSVILLERILTPEGSSSTVQVGGPDYQPTDAELKRIVEAFQDEA